MDSQYIAIPVKGIHIDSRPGFDLYLKLGANISLFHKAGAMFSKDTVLDLIALDKTELFITKKDCRQYEEYRQALLAGQPGKKGMLALEGRFADPAEVAKFYEVLDNYFPVDRRVFAGGLKGGFGLFYREMDRIKPLPDIGTFLGEVSYLPGDLMIRLEDLPSYLGLMDSLFLSLEGSALLQNERLSQKALYLKEMGKAAVQTFFLNPAARENLKILQLVAAETVVFSLESGRDFTTRLADRAMDFYTATHSFNVAVYATGLGLAAGVRRRQDLEWLALGGLLHDVGKIRLDSRIVNKPGKLTLSEFLKIKYHVRLGLDLLKEHHSLPPKVLEMVAQHHERLSGQGYPLGLRAEHIQLFGRIAAVADSFDVLTTDRVYKKALSPMMALDVMSKARDDFDPSLIRDFTHLPDRHSIYN